MRSHGDAVPRDVAQRGVIPGDPLGQLRIRISALRLHLRAMLRIQIVRSP